MKTNYQIKLDEIIKENTDNNKIPKLLLHACCAPCSSYCIEYLSKYFYITLYFYNPNITSLEEHDKRANELKKLIKKMKTEKTIELIIEKYEPERFYNIAKGMEKYPEGGERCFKCYELRLEEAAIYASNNKYDYFTTTLSISPHKNAEKLNVIGKSMSDKYSIDYLFSDFKKKNGYKRSIELSKEYNLYRQNYCGCIFSKNSVTIQS